MSEILNTEVCQDCGTKWTADGEWVMDCYKCPDQQEYCLNCCGCDEHGDDYEPECNCGSCMETEIYGKGMCQECFDQGCDVEDNH